MHKLQIRALPGFPQQVEVKQFLAPRDGADIDDGQATAIDREARPGFQSLRAYLSANGELNAFWRPKDLLDRACFFNDAREHDSRLTQLPSPLSTRFPRDGAKPDRPDS